MTIILGINAYHADASACVIADGRLVAAAEEERFRRIKHWAGFPSSSIQYCLREAGAGLRAVDHVAINQDSRANLGRKLWYSLSHRPDLGLMLARLRNRRRRAGVEEELEKCFPGGSLRARVHHIEHHLAHMASAFLVSPFDEAVALSIDGFGDFASAAWGVGHGDDLQADDKIIFPHSLGMFYQALTQFLGFPNYGDEYKVMGLAAYGTPRFMKEMRHVVSLDEGGRFRLNLQYFRHHREEIAFEWDGGEPVFRSIFAPPLEELLGPARGKEEEITQRHRDIASSVQAMYEEALFHLINVLHAQYRLRALVLAGGCAMNSVANGKVYRNTPFRELYVQSAAGDAGGAIGAACVVSGKVVDGGPSTHDHPRARNTNSISARRFVMDHAYWGPHFSSDHVGACLLERAGTLEAQGCTRTRIDDEGKLCSRTISAIAAGKVIGWFQGRMEWGPRALGNRSILCDPRRADMKDILNLKIKRRESFRPFAPSILREAVAQWFEVDDDVPFMMQVYPIREEKRSRVPAVTHVDGTGRLQTVRRDTNARYYRLIEAFGDLTGVPMLLNTSFNENEPVVCEPEEALDCFLRTSMDVLVMEDWFIERVSSLT